MLKRFLSATRWLENLSSGEKRAADGGRTGVGTDGGRGHRGSSTEQNAQAKNRGVGWRASCEQGGAARARKPATAQPPTTHAALASRVAAGGCDPLRHPAAYIASRRRTRIPGVAPRHSSSLVTRASRHSSHAQSDRVRDARDPGGLLVAGRASLYPHHPHRSVRTDVQPPGQTPEPILRLTSGSQLLAARASLTDSRQGRHRANPSLPTQIEQ